MFRCLGFLVGALARTGRLHVRVSTVGWFIARGLHIQLNQVRAPFTRYARASH